MPDCPVTITDHMDVFAVSARQRRLAHIPHEEVSFIVGHGVEAQIDGRRIRFGNRRFLQDDELISLARARAAKDIRGGRQVASLRGCR